MSPIEQIREAIDTKDWSLAIEAYKTLTGVDLSSGKPKRRRAAKSKPKSKPVSSDNGLCVVGKSLTPHDQRLAETFKPPAVMQDFKSYDDEDWSPPVRRPSDSVETTCSRCNQSKLIPSKLLTIDPVTGMTTGICSECR